MNPPDEGSISFSPGLYGSPSAPIAGETWCSPNGLLWIFNGDAGLWKRRRGGLFQAGAQERCAPGPIAAPAPSSPSAVRHPWLYLLAAVPLLVLLLIPARR